MCNSTKHLESDWLAGKRYRLSDFFNRWWDTYKKSPNHYITEEQYKAVNSIRVCRTEALGIDHYCCDSCGEITKVYHSCKNRFCPTCSWQDTVKWADKIKSNMLNLAHRHVVMTLPHSLNALIRCNRSLLLNLLLRSASGILKEWMLSKYNIRPGIISVLHTFGETKNYHCHVHMIISWGGIDNQTGMLTPIEGEYVDYEFLSRKFRMAFLQSLRNLFKTKVLKHSFTSQISFNQFIHRINKKNWVIHLEPPMSIPSEVVRYIGRYSKRACLSEYKITSIEGDTIEFKYKDYKNLDINKKPIERLLKLHYRDFIPRLLQHVPPKYFRVVRYYGVYANRAAIPKEYLYKEETSKDNNKEEDSDIGNWEDLQIEKRGVNPMICSSCQIRKKYIYTLISKQITGKKIIYYRSDKIPNSAIA